MHFRGFCPLPPSLDFSFDLESWCLVLKIIGGVLKIQNLYLLVTKIHVTMRQHYI